MYTIERFNNLINSLLSTNGRKEKEEILSQYKEDNEVKEIINFIFNPYIVTGISKKKLKKIPNIINGDYNPDIYNIMDLLTYIKNGHNTGKMEDLEKVEEYVRNLFPYKDLIYKIISKEFKLGVQPLTLNKVYGKNFVPLFEIMLAEKYYDDPDKYLPDSLDFILTTKLDGIRCICVYNTNGDINFISRQGQPLEGLTDLTNDVRVNLLPGYVYDGELLLKNNNNLDSKTLYRATIKVTNSDDEKKNIIFHIFDMLTIEEFNNGLSRTSAIERKMTIHKLLSNGQNIQWLKEVEMLYVGNDKSQIQYWLDKITPEGGEGVMINLSDASYECKRSRNILKVKKIQTCDLLCVGMEEGAGVNEGRLGALKVELPAPDGKIYIVDVGGGYSFEDRDYIYSHKDEFINHIIEVQYFEMSQNEQGGYSLRFPIYLGKRDDKTEPSLY